MITFVKAVRDILGLLGSGRRLRWVLLVALAVAVTGLEAIGAILVYVLVGLVSGGGADISMPVVGSIGERFLNASLQTLQLSVAGLVAGFFLIRSAVVIGQIYVHSRLVYNAGARLANHLVRGYLALPYLAHTQVNSAELVRNAFDSVQSLVTKVMKPAVEVVAEIVLVIGLTIVLLIVAPVATLVALAFLGPIVWVLMRVVQPRLKHLGRESQESRRATLVAMQQALGGLRDIQLLGREDEFAGAFVQQRRVMSRTEYLKASLSGVPRTIIELAMILVIATVFILAIVAGEEGMVMSTLGIFAYAGLRLQPSLRKIVQGLNHVRFGTAIIDDLVADRKRVDAALDAQRGRRQHGDTTGHVLQRTIELRNVSFSYAADAPPAVTGIGLTIRKGEFLGICGPTGGGKSTLIDLFSGLLRPTSGEVLIDATPLGDHPTWWYAQLGVVSQNVYLVDDTVRRNIAFGQPDDEIDNDQLLRSIARAQLTDVIATLPAGLETVLGERGIRLSGGQRQRIAVARALYREPSIIIFDEGTSALDAATEAALVSAVDELKVGRTLISVAHRISTVRRADRIIIVEDGRIAAEGTYDDLMRGSALFQSLAR
jgi:ATP-binding cassette, subfamily B, bacterial PglK